MNDNSFFPNHEPIEPVSPEEQHSIPAEDLPGTDAPIFPAYEEEKEAPSAQEPMEAPVYEPAEEAPSYEAESPVYSQQPREEPQPMLYREEPPLYAPRQPYGQEAPRMPQQNDYRPLQRQQPLSYGAAPGQNQGRGYGSIPGQNPYTMPPQNPYRAPASGGYGSVPPTQPPYYGSPAGAPVPKKKKKRSSFNWMLALLIAGCILVGGISGALITGLVRDKDKEDVSLHDPTQHSPTAGQEQETPTQPTAPTTVRETRPLATVSGDQMTLNEIYDANVPAIVGITSFSTETIFGQTAQSTGSGSGFIITSDGEILTNYHVVEDAESLMVTLYDGRELPATLVGYEAESDVALIKIEAENLPVCAIGNSDGVYVGEQIAAIGNPMGELTYTMTVGYVSAVDRFVNTDGTPINMIQVDAAINPGNSGGPVFNLYGEVIGIATAKYSGTISGGATLEGLGFAIPINDITEILDDLRINGRVPDRAYMGVVVSMLPLDKETYGIDHGVFVQSVDESGSAYKAGVQANDVIVKIGDQELNAYENLQQALRKYRAGDQTTLTVYRNGELVTLPITFDAKPEELPTITEPAPTQPAPSEPESTEETVNPWETFPWDEFPWNEFPWGNNGE